jgi:hypothetical protein
MHKRTFYNKARNKERPITNMGKLEALQELRNAWILKYGNSEQIQQIVSSRISDLMSTNTKLTAEVLNSIEDNLKSASRYRSPSGEKLANLYSSKISSASVSHLNRSSRLAESSNFKKTLGEKPSISNATAESHKLKSTNKSKSAKNLIKSSSDFIRLKYPRATQAPKFSVKNSTSMSTSPMKQLPLTRYIYEYPKSVQVSSRYVSNSVENSSGKYDWGRVVRREYEIYEEQAYAKRLKSIEDKQRYNEFLKKQMIEIQNKQEMLKNEDMKEKQRIDAQLRQIKLEEKIQQQEEIKRKNYVQELMDENLRNLEIARQMKENQRSEAKEYVYSKIQEDQLAERAETYKRKVQKKVLASEMSQMINEKLARKLKEKERDIEDEVTKQREMEIILENQARLAQEEREKLMNMQIKVDTLTKLVKST